MPRSVIISYEDLDDLPEITDGTNNAELKGTIEVSATSGNVAGVNIDTNTPGTIGLEFTLPKGENGISPEVSVSTSGKQHTIMITDEEHPNGQSVIVNDGQDAVNPFKGWFDDLTSLQTITPVIGDYGYVRGATTTDPVKIYECTVNGSWSDSGREVDTSNVQTFETGQALNGVAIDDTQLANPAANALAKATDVMQFGDRLYHMDEFNSVAAVVSHKNKKYIDRQDGTIKSIDNTASSAVEVLLNGADYVLFSGVSLNVGNSTVYGFAFGFYNDPNDTSTWVSLQVDTWDYEGSAKAKKTYLRKVPTGATHFRTMSACYGTLTESDFFCKLIYGSLIEEELGGLYGYGSWDETDITIAQNRYIDSNGTVTGITNSNVYAIDVTGCRYILVEILCNRTNLGYEYSYSFYDSQNNAIRPTRYQNNLNGSIAVREQVLFVPQNAVTFKMSVLHRDLNAGLYSYFVKKRVVTTDSLNDRINSANIRLDELSADVNGLYNLSVGQIQLSDILRYDSTGYVRGYIDEDIVSLKIDMAQNSVIECLVIKEKTGTNTGNVVIASGKNILVNWKRDEAFTHLVLRFGTTDSSAISVAGVLSAIEDSNITYENLQKQDRKNDVVEMPITGLVQSQDATKIVADAIYTPEQYNLGGFEIVLPTYMGVTWYRGDNPDTFTRYASYYNGKIVNFLTKYSYNNIFRLEFFIIGSSRTILVSDVEDAIENGRLKILYRPNDGHLSITQRQTHCEPYLRALQARLVTDYSPTQRKSYGTHDLPMFVHCTDVHNDIVRLSSAFEYARYIQADALILTGDYVMRGATNGYGYIKELDDKWNPEGQNATQRIPYLVGTGNHDPWHVTLEEMRSKLIDPFIEKHNYKLDENNLISDVAYYYVDMDVPAPRNGGYEYNEPLYNNTQKVRIIMLDLVDEQAGEISRWGISQTQIEWFIDTLNSTPQGAAILIGLHTLPDEGVAPSDKAADYATENPRIRELRYVSDMFTYKGFLPYDEETLNGTYDFSGSPIVEIIDAYISRGQASGTYSYKVGGTSHSIPQQAAVTKTVNWSCDFSNAGGVFVAYLCGHTHTDFVTYIDNSANTQLCLCNTCTVCEYGPYRNGRGSSNADCIRGSSGSTQDGFNVYVLDMENKRVGIARIGSNMTVNLEPRTACWISFADSLIQ